MPWLRLSDTTMNMLQRTIVSPVWSDPSFWSTASTILANLSYFHSDYSEELAENSAFFSPQGLAHELLYK
jgi:hypothetical protein